MTQYSVLLLPDGSEAGRFEDDSYLAHVEADSISKAMAAGQIDACENRPNQGEPIDWAVLLICEGHVIDVKDAPDRGDQNENVYFRR